MTTASQLAALDWANRVRSEHSALHKVVAARRALRTVQRHRDTRSRYLSQFEPHVQSLVARINYPDASLAEIAAMTGMSKDVYSGRLRRALAFAQRLELDSIKRGTYEVTS